MILSMAVNGFFYVILKSFCWYDTKRNMTKIELQDEHDPHPLYDSAMPRLWIILNLREEKSGVGRMDTQEILKDFECLGYSEKWARYNIMNDYSQRCPPVKIFCYFLLY